MSERLFQGFERGPDFDRARTRVATRFSLVSIDLGTTCPAEGVVYNVAGDFLYSDLSSQAEVFVEFNSDAPGISPAVMLSPGTGVDALFSSIRVFWSLGSGTVSLIFATGDRIRPQSAATSILGQVEVQVTGSTKSGYAGSGTVPIDLLAMSSASLTMPVWAVSNATESYGANRQLLGVREHGVPGTATSFKSTTALAANTAETVLAPASNTAGVIVFAGGSLNITTVQSHCPLIAKTSAPTTIIDGDVLTSPINLMYAASLAYYVAHNLDKPHRAQTGKGLYWISGAAETLVPFRRCNYLLF